jgi:RHS repeat-associated protein
VWKFGSCTQHFAYDLLGRLKGVTTPPTSVNGSPALARTATTAYTLDGLRASATDFNGTAVAFAYDSARRLKGVDYPDGTPDVGYRYDKAGNRTTMLEGGQPRAAYTYDELGRRTSEARDGRAVGYGYDRRALTRVVSPDGKPVVYGHDEGGRLREVAWDWPGIATGRATYAYDDAGRRTEARLPNGVATLWGYDEADRLTSAAHWKDGGLLARYTFGPDKAGNRRWQTNVRFGQVSTQEFGYDGAGRLEWEKIDGTQVAAWQYDAAGNKKVQTVRGVTTTYEYDADNRLRTAAVSGGATDEHYYDANGSTTGVYHGATATRTDYAWDAAGRLTRVQKAGGTPTTFGYDGDGVRVWKTHNLTTTRYVNNTLGLSSVLQELTGPVDAPVARTQVPGVGQHDASKANTPDAWAYSHADATNGRLMTDRDGNPSKWWDYDPWGTVLAEGGTAETSFDYAGEQRDREVGLIFLRARSYDPALGRFLSRDSWGGQDFAPQSWNRYTYAENDPVNHVDPSGHKRQKIKWANGADPDDDDRARKRARACRNPGQWTGSCRNGPPNRAYAAHGEADHHAKVAGQAANAGDLARAVEEAEGVAHFAALAATPAAYTVALQAFSTVGRALWFARLVDNITPSHEFQGKIIPDDGSSVRYSYDWDWEIGPRSIVGSPEEVMTYFLANPRQIFPFGLRQCNEIKMHNTCDLDTGPTRFAPVEVTDITTTSFTFTARFPHFDWHPLCPDCSTITFTIVEKEDLVYLRHTGRAVPISRTIGDIAAPQAYETWRKMANNLRGVLNPGAPPVVGPLDHLREPKQPPPSPFPSGGP